MAIQENLLSVKKEIPSGVELVAVSKTKPDSAILEAYETGQRIFGENKVQELVGKQERLPKDIQWHMIGHLQSKKVKQIVPFVSLIHAVDSEKLLLTIEKEAAKKDKTVNCLLQIHIAQEEHKFGFSKAELVELLQTDILEKLQHTKIAGLMGMATNTSDEAIIRKEFQFLRQLFDELKSGLFSEQSNFKHLSMGMSSDYKIAIEEGSSLVRVGSHIFGARDYSI